MKDGAVSKRYAKALFQLAKEKNKINQTEEELRIIQTSLFQDKNFEKLINHPNIQISSKKELINKIFKDKISDHVLNILNILIENNRFNCISQLTVDFIKLSNEELGQAQAIIYSPHQINNTELNEIVNKFSFLTNKKIRAEVQLDESLLGGIKVKIGDRLYDGTLSGKLKQLSKTLEQTQVL
jgi:F-type H+-transporting ATPase subunit delta